MSDAPGITRRLIEVDSWSHKAKRRVKNQVVVDVLPTASTSRAPVVRAPVTHAPPQLSPQSGQTIASSCAPSTCTEAITLATLVR